MKKRWLALFLGVILLCGCRSGAEPETVPPESWIPTIPPQKPTEPVGFYEPNNPLEAATDGAVRVYPLGLGDVSGFLFLGDDILIFSGSGQTTLTLLAGESRYVSAQVKLPYALSLDDPGVAVCRQGISYPDYDRRELVFLDQKLEEAKRVSFPEDARGSVGISEDWAKLYYCTGDALRVLDLDTGFDRLLKEMFFQQQTVSALHCGGTVIECDVQHSDGSRSLLFLSAGTGALLWEAMEEFPLWTAGDFYFAVRADGDYWELITGSGHYGPSVLVTEEPQPEVTGVPALRSAVQVGPGPNDTTTVNYYDLESGRRTHSLQLPRASDPQSVQPGSDGAALWFLLPDRNSGGDALCRWELEQSSVDDPASYLQSRHSEENPDLQGLRRCAQLAEQISAKHDVEILLWEDAVQFQPPDHTLVAEYQVPLIEDRLHKLDEALSQYPAGFLKEAASQTRSGKLRICLVRAIWGAERTAGLQYWDRKANAYMALTLGSNMEQQFHHELFHLIDSRVLSSCSAYDDWSSPQELSAREERARIMEYAMLPGQEDTFRPDAMQAKLRKLCLGIREAFDLKNIYPWEQYLSEPLGPSK